MNRQSNLSVIILTYNEQKHISRCIGSVSDIASDIFIVDAHSTDKTCELAAAQGAKVIRNKWVNYATQFNWALDNLPINTDWVLRLDADEIVTGHLQKELASCIDQLPESIAGIYVNRRVHFLGRWIRYGGMYPMYVMRLFRFGFGYCEPRWMDEHMVITDGKSIKIEGDIIDDNLNNLGWWISKHNDYALREAIDMLNIKFKFIPLDGITPKFYGSQEQRKRWLKNRYASMPLFVRPIIYFFYRYLVKLGVLDGIQGLVWHFLQGLWYRFLVDAKIYEICAKGGTDADSVKRVIQREYAIDLSGSDP